MRRKSKRGSKSEVKPFVTELIAEEQPSRKPLPYSVFAEGKFLTPVKGRGFIPQFQSAGIGSTSKHEEVMSKIKKDEIFNNDFNIFFKKSLMVLKNVIKKVYQALILLNDFATKIQKNFIFNINFDFYFLSFKLKRK